MTAPLGRRLDLHVGAHGKAMKGAPIGYDDEELFPGVRAAAAAISDARGRKVAFIMVVGFKQRVDLRRIGERCAAAAAAIGHRIGAPPEEPA